MAITSFPASAGGGASKEKNFEFFTASGSWTCPSGVNSVLVTLCSGGGGGGGATSGNPVNGSNGGNTSGFGKIVRGGSGSAGGGISSTSGGRAAGANSGLGGACQGGTVLNNSEQFIGNGHFTPPQRFTSDVDAGTSYSFTIGGGGSGGNNGGNGGSGYINIEYEV